MVMDIPKSKTCDDLEGLRIRQISDWRGTDDRGLDAAVAYGRTAPTF